MAVMSALGTGRPLPPGRFLVLISVKRLDCDGKYRIHMYGWKADTGEHASSTSPQIPNRLTGFWTRILCLKTFLQVMLRIQRHFKYTSSNHLRSSNKIYYFWDLFSSASRFTQPLKLEVTMFNVLFLLLDGLGRLACSHFTINLELWIL
jgi:hypothetical protein